MTDLSVKSGLSGKIGRLFNALRREGVGGAFRRLKGYARYHLVEKHHFLYFLAPVEGSSLLSMKTPDAVTVRHATPDDLPRIHEDVFPHLIGEFEYERRYFDRLGAPGLICFVAESGGRIVHYSWVFIDAAQSIIRDVPYDKRLILPGDAFIGPVFTTPDARGMIYLYVISHVMKYLASLGGSRRLLLFIEANSAAPTFYRRLGFAQVTGKMSDRIVSE